MDWLVSCAGAVPVAMAVDAWWGEPSARWHPVVWMGRFLNALAPRLLALPAAAAFLGGALAWCLGAVAVGAMAWGLARAVQDWMQALLGQGPGAFTLALGALSMGLALKPMMAWRMLRDEVAGVESALSVGLDEGRARLSRLVSRDVTELDEALVRESAIETLAENLNDSVVAPLFWFAVGGLAGAAVYRFANTADAMWGYRGRFEWAGKWSARADDVLSWLPARLTAVCLCAAAGRRPAWPGLSAQARMTPSPNGGWPMGAMALLLGVRLRKPGAYALNERQCSPEALDTGRALMLAGRAAAWAATACVLSLLLQAWAAMEHAA